MTDRSPFTGFALALAAAQGPGFLPRNRVAYSSTSPGTVDMILAAPDCPTRLRFTIVDNIRHFGMADDSDRLDGRFGPLSSANAHRLWIETLLQSPSYPLATHAAATDRTFSPQAQVSLVRSFVAGLPEDVRAYLQTIVLTRPANDEFTGDFLVDPLWRALTLIDGLTADGIAALSETMNDSMAFRHLLYARVFEDDDYFWSPNADHDLSARQEHEAFLALVKSVASRQPFAAAYGSYLDFFHKSSLSKAVRSLLPATVLALSQSVDPDAHRATEAIEHFHRTYPQAPPLTPDDVSRLSEVLSRLGEALDATTSEQIVPSLAQILRMESALPANFGADLSAFVCTLADALSCLAPASYDEIDLFHAAWSIALPPDATSSSLKATLARWNYGRAADADRPFDFECGIGRSTVEIVTPFPHFLRGPATAVISGAQVTATPLVTTDAIYAEMDLLGHRLGQCCNLAATGRHMLVALETPDDRSTLLICPTLMRYEILDHRGAAGEPPSQIHQDLANGLVAQAFHTEHGRSTHAAVMSLPDVEDAYEDMTDEERTQFEALNFELIKPFLGPDEAALTLATWIETRMPGHVARFP